MEINKTCPICGKLFTSKVQSQIRCSRKCYGLSRRKPGSEKKSYLPRPPRTKRCEICGSEIMQARNKKYCPECREKRAAQLKYRYVQSEKYKEAHRRRAKAWQQKNKDKYKASCLAKSHPERLNILYECHCEAIGKHHHHFDYSKPYDVILLCDACHASEHKRLRSLVNPRHDSPQHQAAYLAEGSVPSQGRPETRPNSVVNA